MANSRYYSSSSYPSASIQPPQFTNVLVPMGLTRPTATTPNNLYTPPIIIPPMIESKIQVPQPRNTQISLSRMIEQQPPQQSPIDENENDTATAPLIIPTRSALALSQNLGIRSLPSPQIQLPSSSSRLSNLPIPMPMPIQYLLPSTSNNSNQLIPLSSQERQLALPPITEVATTTTAMTTPSSSRKRSRYDYEPNDDSSDIKREPPAERKILSKTHLLEDQALYFPSLIPPESIDEKLKHFIDYAVNVNQCGSTREQQIFNPDEPDEICFDFIKDYLNRSVPNQNPGQKYDHEGGRLVIKKPLQESNLLYSLDAPIFPDVLQKWHNVTSFNLLRKLLGPEVDSEGKIIGLPIFLTRVRNSEFRSGITLQFVNYERNEEEKGRTILINFKNNNNNISLLPEVIPKISTCRQFLNEALLRVKNVDICSSEYNYIFVSPSIPSNHICITLEYPPLWASFHTPGEFHPFYRNGFDLKEEVITFPFIKGNLKLPVYQLDTSTVKPSETNIPLSQLTLPELKNLLIGAFFEGGERIQTTDGINSYMTMNFRSGKNRFSFATPYINTSLNIKNCYAPQKNTNYNRYNDWQTG
jgi:hypothetical protein